MGILCVLYREDFCSPKAVIAGIETREHLNSSQFSVKENFGGPLPSFISSTPFIKYVILTHELELLVFMGGGNHLTLLLGCGVQQLFNSDLDNHALNLTMAHEGPYFENIWPPPVQTIRAAGGYSNNFNCHNTVEAELNLFTGVLDNETYPSWFQ
ncbi:hypothetical protein EVAR_82679_1 [Eumeta japonica]|uniref:Uncharacterized protein n=1 Tax=Eumeta variegata TaxID=151549 RepID=A0A4C1VCS8_EUMVA|nr:hypothetical protein EVAR_82679_1 [Eumeta japonica]